MTDDGWKVRDDGYVYRVAERRILYQHRQVAWELYGYGPHLCHHCRTHINWGDGRPGRGKGRRTWDGVLVVDHLDHDRGNNEPENLALSCQRCNLSRRMSWLRELKRRVREDLEQLDAEREEGPASV